MEWVNRERVVLVNGERERVECEIGVRVKLKSGVSELMSK